MLSFLEETVARNLVRYAAGQHMFCPQCQSCLDCKTTVITTDDVSNKVHVQCAECYGHPIGSFSAGIVRVYDGRDLWPSKSKLLWRFK